MKRRLVGIVAAFGVCAPVALAPGPALACGGLFCSSPLTVGAPPEPVDQSAERIIFQVGQAGRVTAHVQIKYTGSADAFAWVIPLPSVPVVADSSVALFDALDDATRLDVQLPEPEPCPQPSEGRGFGCGGARAATTLGQPCSAMEPCGPDAVCDASLGVCIADEGAPKKGVKVHAHQLTRNYEYHVISADRTAALVTWLQGNRYNVSDNMTPVIDPYNGPTMRFLALKLREGKQASDIVPVAMTFSSPILKIPLRLTAVAAQPLMGILVFIVADRSYRPDNFRVIEPAPGAIKAVAQLSGRTPFGFRRLTFRSSYFAWVARESDEADGKLFVREFIGPNRARGAAGRLGKIVSRYYTRMSPHHMTRDPTFVADSVGARKGRDLNLTRQGPLMTCGRLRPEAQPDPCDLNYCGKGATCVQEGDGAACRCKPGDVAQAITGPEGEARVTCVPPTNRFGITAVAGGVGTANDPCRSAVCVSGRCVLKGGFPTCACDPGTVAALGGKGTVTCRRPTGAVSAPLIQPRRRRSESSAGLGLLLAALGLAGAGAVHRRRR